MTGTARPEREPLLPGATLGVIGGGQLGRYFVLEARRLGYRCCVLDPDPGAPAMQLADVPVVGAYDDADALTELAERCEAVTIEFENVPSSSLEWLAPRVRLAPHPAHVALAQDRRAEKRIAREHGLTPVEWRAIESEADIGAHDGAGPRDLMPGILKTATLGYDGKGQRGCDTPRAVLEAFREFGGVPCVLERRVPLVAELSVVLARGEDGEVAVFPPAENVHLGGILHLSSVPARVDAALLERAVADARRLADGLGYVGVLAVEFFVVEGEGGGVQGSEAQGGVSAERRLEVRFNEMAPRPHNSGHYTLDATATSQFGQQLRALAGLPLGDVRLLTPVAMLNLLGDAWSGAAPPPWRRVFDAPGAVLHLYGKAAARPGRKMGHVNCLAPQVDEALGAAEALHRALVARD